MLNREQLQANFEQGLRFLDEYMSGSSEVHLAAADLTQTAGRIGVPLAFSGNFALFLHGYRQAMRELQVVVERRYWTALAAQPGWARVQGKRSWLEHLATGLHVRMHPAGEVVYGGPVRWPFPPNECEVQSGYPILDLNTYLETECAQALNSVAWYFHAANVQNAIKGAGAQLDRATGLHPFVAEKYEEIWALATTLDWVHELPPERRL